MTRIEIVKNGLVTNAMEHSDKAIALKWLEKHKAKGTFGLESSYKVRVINDRKIIKNAKKCFKKFALSSMVQTISLILIYHFVVKFWLG